MKVLRKAGLQHELLQSIWQLGTPEQRPQAYLRKERWTHTAVCACRFPAPGSNLLRTPSDAARWCAVAGSYSQLKPFCAYLPRSVLLTQEHSIF